MPARPSSSRVPDALSETVAPAPISPAPTALPAVTVQPGFVAAAEALRAEPDAPVTPSADVAAAVAQVNALVDVEPVPGATLTINRVDDRPPPSKHKRR